MGKTESAETLIDQIAYEPTDDLLIREVRSGCSRSMAILIKRYFWLISKVASSYYIQGADQDDLYQEGYIALYKAVRTFNFEKNTSFRSFAELCITAGIKNAVKLSNRQKHKILNHSFSLNAPISFDSTEEWITVLPDTRQNTVEGQIIDKESVTAFLTTLKQELSPFEYSVAMMQAHSFGIAEIAESLGVAYKKVDNAVQRIRRKLSK